MDNEPTTTIDNQSQDTRLGFDPEKSIRNAEFYLKRPEALELMHQELAKHGMSFVPAEKFNALENDVLAMKRDSAVKEALLDNGLTKEHARYITGNTPDEINEAARGLAALLESQKQAAGDGESKPVAKPAPKPEVKTQERYEEPKPSGKPESVADIMNELRNAETKRSQP